MPRTGWPASRMSFPATERPTSPGPGDDGPGVTAARTGHPSLPSRGTDMPQHSPARVLVVDAYPDAADSIALLLRLWGYDVRVAYTGPAALDLARTFLPDVVLTELSLR